MQIEYRPLCPILDAKSLFAFELAGFRLPFEMCETFPHPLVLYPWNSSPSFGRWAQAKEVESIGQEQEVWIGEMVATIGWGKTWSEQAEAMAEEEEAWIVTSLVPPSLTGPQLG